MNRSGQPAETETSSSHGLFHWPLFWFFAFLALAASATGYAAFLLHGSDTRQEYPGRLFTIADLKVAEIVNRTIYFALPAEEAAPGSSPC